MAVHRVDKIDIRLQGSIPLILYIQSLLYTVIFYSTCNFFSPFYHPKLGVIWKSLINTPPWVCVYLYMQSTTMKNHANLNSSFSTHSGPFLLPWVNNDAGRGIYQCRLLEKMRWWGSSPKYQGRHHHGMSYNYTTTAGLNYTQTKWYPTNSNSIRAPTGTHSTMEFNFPQIPIPAKAPSPTSIQRNTPHTP